jgi:hypothetical protein
VQDSSTSQLKKIGTSVAGMGMYVGGLLILVGSLLLVVLFIHGMVWASNKAFPWLVDAGLIAFLICVFVFLPLCIFRKTRPWAGLGFYCASYLFGVLLFAYSCLFAFYAWGYLGLVIGLVLAGVGVVPVALLAALLDAEWSVLGQLLFGLVLTFGTRALGIRLSTGHPTSEDVLTD